MERLSSTIKAKPFKAMPTLAVAILAGGQSQRMGRDKALLPIGQQTLVQRVIDAADPLGDEHLLISNNPSSHGELGWPLQTDEQAGLGPIGGLFTALLHTQSETLLLLACDLPHLNTPFLRFLTQHHFDAHGAIVPDSPDGL